MTGCGMGRACPLCGKELELSDNGLRIVACPSCGEIGAFLNDIDEMGKWISWVSDEALVARMIGRCDDVSNLSALCGKSPEFIAEVMRCICDTDDAEYAHGTADDLITILLRGLGYGEAMDEYRKIRDDTQDST